MTTRTCPVNAGYPLLALLLALSACSTDATDDDTEAEGAAGQDVAGDGAAGDGAAGDGAAGAVADGPSFRTDIHPLLVASCNGCHAATVVSGPPRPGGPMEGGANAPGKFAVDDPAAAYTAITPYVIAGNPTTSTLYIKISEDEPTTGGQRMPPALRQWDDASIAKVHDWITAGATNN